MLSLVAGGHYAFQSLLAHTELNCTDVLMLGSQIASAKAAVCTMGSWWKAKEFDITFKFNIKAASPHLVTSFVNPM